MNTEHFISTKASALNAVLSAVSRQYLAGNLKRPQELPFVVDDKVEIGITSYDSEQRETPHWHSEQKEFQFVLSDRTEYVEIPSGIRHVYEEGDFYAIPPGVCYGQISEPGTRTIFIKHPALDDKTVCRKWPRIDCYYREEPFANNS